MKTVLNVKRVVLGIAIAGCCAVFAATASATTAPGVLNHIRVVLTDSAIQIPRDQFDKKGSDVTRYPRGAEIEFTLVNKGSKPISVRIKALGKTKYTINSKTLAGSASAGKPIAPGATRHWTLGFYIRGNYEMDSLVNGKVAVKKSIEVF